MEDKQREIVNGANPSIIWTQYMDFLATYAKQMKSQYAKRMRENNPFTWTDLDVMNKEIHDKLDYLMTWDKNVNQNANVQQQSSITNESNRRQHKVRISESHLREIVAESVKKVLREEIDIKQEIEQYVRTLGSSVEEWYGYDEFCDKHGCGGFIFNSEEEARDCVLNGDEHQNAIDFVEGAQSPEDWVSYLINGGVAPTVANKVIRNEDWNTVVKMIVSKCGPEWFLSQDSGKVHELSNGKLLYY